MSHSSEVNKLKTNLISLIIKEVFKTAAISALLLFIVFFIYVAFFPTLWVAPLYFSGSYSLLASALFKNWMYTSIGALVLRKLVVLKEIYSK
jgi:hypothetical protein